MCGFKHVSSEPPCFDVLCRVKENLVVAQHRDTSCYVTIHGGVYQF
jgi:hypothetical protein